MKSELELALNKLSRAQQTGEPIALTPAECRSIVERLDELIAALDPTIQHADPEKRLA